MKRDSYPAKSKEHIVVAFQTVGYISVLVARYLEEKGIIKDLFGINIEDLEEFAMIRKGEIVNPIRVLEGSNFLVVTSHFPLPRSAANKIVDKIFDMYKSYGARDIIIIEGLPIEEGREKSSVYYASNMDDEIPKKTKKLEEGAMIGLNASMAIRGRRKKIPVRTLMVETHENIPDGEAAAQLIDSLSDMINIKVDTAELISEYKKTLAKINELIKQVQAPRKDDGQEQQEMYV